MESRLGEVITEYMNAEIVLGTVNDPSSALQWLKSTFLYVRARREPFKYGFPRLQVTGSDASVDSWIEKTYVTSTLEKLIRSGMVERSDDGTMQAAQPGVIMSESYIKLHTMMELFKVRHTASMEDLLWVIAKSSELSSIMIRRSEKKVLNALNDAPQSSIKYKVLDSKKSPRKVLKRVQEPCEKIFLLVCCPIIVLQFFTASSYMLSIRFILSTDADDVRLVQLLLRSQARLFLKARVRTNFIHW